MNKINHNKWLEYNTLSGPTADGTRMREVAKTCSPNHWCTLTVQREEEKSNLLSKGHDDGTYK